MSSHILLLCTLSCMNTLFYVNRCFFSSFLLDRDEEPTFSYLILIDLVPILLNYKYSLWIYCVLELSPSVYVPRFLNSRCPLKNFMEGQPQAWKAFRVLRAGVSMAVCSQTSNSEFGSLFPGGTAFVSQLKWEALVKTVRSSHRYDRHATQELPARKAEPLKVTLKSFSKCVRYENCACIFLNSIPLSSCIILFSFWFAILGRKKKVY